MVQVENPDKLNDQPLDMKRKCHKLECAGICLMNIICTRPALLEDGMISWK